MSARPALLHWQFMVYNHCLSPPPCWITPGCVSEIGYVLSHRLSLLLPPHHGSPVILYGPSSLPLSLSLSSSPSQMKLGYVSRVYPKDKSKHVVLAVQVRGGQA